MCVGAHHFCTAHCGLMSAISGPNGRLHVGNEPNSAIWCDAGEAHWWALRRASWAPTTPSRRRARRPTTHLWRPPTTSARARSTSCWPAAPRLPSSLSALVASSLAGERNPYIFLPVFHAMLLLCTARSLTSTNTAEAGGSMHSSASTPHASVHPNDS